MRDHVAIAKKAARTRAAMKAARDPEAKAKYDAKRRLEEVRRAARELIADKAGYAAWAEQWRRKTA